MSDPRSALEAACHQAGIDRSSVSVIRSGENTLFLLPGRIVARVGRMGQEDAARKEVRVARWLNHVGIAAVEPVPDIDQPVVIDGRATTFWRELPNHHEGDLDLVAATLRRVHRLQPPPELELPALAPFVRLSERITEAAVYNEDDREWLLQHLGRLQQQYENLPEGLRRAAIHGDAWGGNIVDTAAGPVVLDLERFAFGPPEWDLASIAVSYDTFGTVTKAEWDRFCDRYGQDVTTWNGYSVLRDIRELRKVTFAGQMATQQPALATQARYRLRCIQGLEGPRPWYWQPVP